LDFIWTIHHSCTSSLSDSIHISLPQSTKCSDSSFQEVVLSKIRDSFLGNNDIRTKCDDLSS
jgi:hypothetical protein